MADLKKYAKKVMPLLRGAAVVIETVEPRAKETTCQGCEPEAQMVKRILAARQRPPLAGVGMANSLPSDAEEFMMMAIKEIHADRETATKVAVTIARMEGKDRIETVHLSEAIQYRCRLAARWVDDFEEVSQ
jgi:hypothetical protein